jgi:hypothetical protein
MYPIEIEPARAKKTLVFSLLGRLGEAGRQRITLSAPVAPLEAIVGNKEGGPSPKDESRLGADSRSPREVSTPHKNAVPDTFGGRRFRDADQGLPHACRWRTPAAGAGVTDWVCEIRDLLAWRFRVAILGRSFEWRPNNHCAQRRERRQTKCPGASESARSKSGADRRTCGHGRKLHMCRPDGDSAACAHPNRKRPG